MLNITILQRTDTFDPAVTLLDPSLVDVWMLDAPTELSRYIDGATTYAPKRKELLTTLSFSATSPDTFGEFHCPSGQFTTLELTCSPTTFNCNVDFWQDQRARPLGGSVFPIFVSFIVAEHLRRSSYDSALVTRFSCLAEYYYI